MKIKDWSGRESLSSKTRSAVLERDGYSCRYCGNTHGPFEIDHVYPVCRGGETTISNLVTACISCNRDKQAKVGIWPKPVGYFQPKPLHISDTVYFVAALLYLLVGMIFGALYTYPHASTFLVKSSLAVLIADNLWFIGAVFTLHLIKVFPSRHYDS